MALPMGIVALLIGCVLGWYGRYGVIEPDHLQALCSSATPAAGCAARDLLIEITFRGTYGITAVVAGILVWFLRRRAATAVALAGLFAGGLGLYLFDTSWAASGVLCILLRLPRIGEEPPDPREFSA